MNNDVLAYLFSGLALILSGASFILTGYLFKITDNFIDRSRQLMKLPKEEHKTSQRATKILTVLGIVVIGSELLIIISI